MRILPGNFGLLFGTSGILVTFMYYGSLQEDVFDFKDPKGNKFNQVWLLQSIEALANVIVGYIGMKLSGITANLPLSMFAVSGATQVAAKACMSLSLASGLSFPVATLAKSAKMAPVMVGTIFIGGKTYPLRQYVQVALIIAGAVMVSANSHKSGNEASSLLGAAYICISLTCDGLTSGVQDKLKIIARQRGVKVKPYDMMFWSNFFMLGVASVIALIPHPECDLETGLSYILSNPEILQKILMFALCSAIGQSFIFFVVAEYGPLKCVAITTTRKIFSVFLSLLIKGHTVSPLGWFGLVLGSVGIGGELIPERRDEEQQASVAIVESKAAETERSVQSVELCILAPGYPLVTIMATRM